MKKEMLINVAQAEECRIAIVENGVLEELYVERASQESYVGNIYKGKIVNIEPSIQAAFVDFGIGRNGFLHVSDVDPTYYKHLLPKHVLAEIEAEQEAQYGERPRRDDRRPRRESRRDSEPLKTWLPPETVTPSSDVDEGFGTGLLDTPAAWNDLQPETNSDGFGVGLDSPPPLPVMESLPPLPKLEKPKPESLKPRTEVVLNDDAGFGAGLEIEEEVTAEEVVYGEETPEADIEPAEEKKPKRKPGGKGRKPRRKGDDAPGEAPPPYMESAEHRTSPPEEEGEILPFFGGGLDDSFDVNAPNDRFGASSETVNDDAFSGFVEEETTADSESTPLDEPKPALVNDDEFAPPPSREERSERRGRRGDRGERGSLRDDRGPRRDDRGPRRDDRGPRRSMGGPTGGRPPRDGGLPRLPIEQIFKRGQEVLVQVIKEGIGTKGPTLSTYISIAGRYLVLMPSLQRVGVSRKIEDADARKRLREIMRDLDPPAGVGFIVRTAAIDRNPDELTSDLAYLLRLWQVIVRRLRKVSAPVEIYRESDMITRTIRDNFKSDITSITVDDPVAFQHAAEFMQVVMPRYADRIRQHGGPEPLFNKYRLEDEIAKLNHKRLELPKGGSIIIEQTEALVAIDVNSGTYRSEKDAEETAFQVNLMAAKEIARQLRLRDLGGVIVNDFIDMRDERHRRVVEKTLHDALERDKARTKILRISQFGIIEMTRQRMQQSLKKRIYNDCPHCKGTGHVKTNETLGIDAMRLLHLAASKAIAGNPQITSLDLTVCQDAANYLLNRKRREIARLEENAKMEITINGVLGGSPDLLEIKCQDSNGNEVKLLANGPPPKASGKSKRFD